MNTPDRPDDDLQCAEYALGVLDSDSRRALERRAHRDAALRATLDAWIARFAPLADDLAPIDPPAHVWTRIQRDLGLLPAAPVTSVTPARARWWNNVSVWRWLFIGASAAALLLLAVNLATLLGVAQRPTAVVAQNGYMVATIARSDGVTHWTATVDVRRARMVVVPTVYQQVAADRSTELWLIPHGAKPIPLGVFAANAPASVPLSPEVVARITSGAVLAVSLEPHGGSPTGQPTGPVLATGEIHAA